MPLPASTGGFCTGWPGWAEYEASIAGKALTREEYLAGKELGYPDAALARLSDGALPEHLSAIYKMVDTCAAEFSARTPYFYSGWGVHCEARSFARSGRPHRAGAGQRPNPHRPGHRV